jgi:hypothetical protein
MSEGLQVKGYGLGSLKTMIVDDDQSDQRI